MENAHLYEQLVRLGDLMGDGCHLEPDGKWIEEDYRHILLLLGLIPAKHTRKNKPSKRRKGVGE